MWPARRFPAMLLVTLALGLLVASLAAEAQHRGNVHRIGLLNYGSPPSRPGGRLGGAFRQGLRDLGWVEGQNLVIGPSESDAVISGKVATNRMKEQSVAI
jgi:hypothetical protein